MLNRQYDRTIRWINRAQSRSADGNFSDAILDVECARAELDNAREELLLCHQLGGERKRIMGLPLAVLTACFITLFAATPTRIQPAQSADASTPFFKEAAQTAAITPAPVPVIITKENSKAPLAADSEIKETGKEIPEQAAQAAEKIDEALPVPGQQTSVKAASKPGPVLSDNDMYRLVEVGRNALRQKNESVVLEFN